VTWQRTEPGRDINPGCSRFRRAGTPILDQHFPPLAFVGIELIKALHDNPFSSLGVPRADVANVQLGANAPAGTNLADCVHGQGRGVGQVFLASLDQSRVSAESVGDNFGDQLLPGLGTG
jgi:hypothetical protein